MKKITLLIILVLISICTFSQKKKKHYSPPAVKQELILEMPTDNPNMVYYDVQPYNPFSANITFNNGNDSLVWSLESLMNIDFSKLKSISLYTMDKNQKMNETLLNRLFSEAVGLESLTIQNFILDSFPNINTINHHLKKLDLNKNNLKMIDAKIANFKALESFNSYNPLEVLPESFAQLTQLETVVLNNMYFSEFPISIFKLHKLKFLYIGFDNNLESPIKELPDMFIHLPNLEEISITNAALTSLPASFSSLKKLRNVDFSYNKFVAFPEILAEMKQLTFVPFNNNPLQWNPFFDSIKKIKWRGLFFLHSTGFTKSQYEQVQKALPKMDVYYDGMND